MDDDAIKRLRALAERATPLEVVKSIPQDGFECYWFRADGREVGSINGPQCDERDALCAYIAAANPAAVLSLLDEREALRAALAAEQPQPVGVQACRPEDRALLATPAGAELVAKVAQALAVPKAVATAPPRIWLQIGSDRDHLDEPFPSGAEAEVTWCSDSVGDAEVEYVRADLAAPPAPAATCPHIRSSGEGEWATNWCALNGPPAPAAQPAPAASERSVYGILDPDYARIFTIARCIAWSEGYALAMHGSFTRDLDLLAVPWTDAACEPEHLIRRIESATGTKLNGRPPSEKPHGRLAWTLLLPAFGDPRFVDLSVMSPSGAGEKR